MKGKKLLNIFLATMLVFSSTATSVFAGENKSNSKESKEVSSNNYIKDGDSHNDDNNDNNDDGNKYDNAFKDCNLGKAAAKVVCPPKAVNIAKDCIKSKDYNLGKDVNIGNAIRNAQAKAKEIVKEPVKVTPPTVEISQELKDQIKAQYTIMRSTEVTNKAIFVAAVDKKNQVVNYIYKVAEGKIAYTDAQLTQLDTLSTTFATDIKAVINATASIKAAEALVDVNVTNKNFDAALAALKTEAAARVARGTALTKVSQDLDAFLLVLAEGQAVLPTSVTPATEPKSIIVPTT